MWLNIFIIVIGTIFTFIAAVYAADSYLNYKKSSENEKKAWKRALEGWGILLFFLILSLLTDFLRLISSIIN
jgi:purine-cytosine permease-like protein